MRWHILKVSGDWRPVSWPKTIDYQQTDSFPHLYLLSFRLNWRQNLDAIALGVTVLGIDENTGVVIEPATGVYEYLGQGSAIVLTSEGEQIFDSGARFPATALRDEIPALGWQAHDTLDGPCLERTE